MRKNQISIHIERFGDQVPKHLNSTHQTISVYADSNNFATAMFEALYLVMKEVEEDSNDNPELSLAYAIMGQQATETDMQKLSRKLFDESMDISGQLNAAKLDLFAAEHQMEICNIIAESSTREQAAETLQNRYEEMFRRTISRAPSVINNFSIRTESEIEALRGRIDELQERYDIVQKQKDSIDEIR